MTPRADARAVRIVKRLASRVLSLYPAHAAANRDDVIAFVEDAVDQAWAVRRWRGLLSVSAMVTRDVLATRMRPAGLPITRHGRSPLGTDPEQKPDWRLHVERLQQDIRLALRLLARSPGFSAVAILTIALGIGATTTVYTVVDGAILRPFPYPDMSRIVLLTEMGGNGQPMSVAWPNFQDWQSQADVFDELGVYRGMTVNYTSSDVTERLSASLVSSSVFATAGIPALAGRVFTAEDDGAGVPTIAIVSERFWRAHLGASPTILNRAITLDGRPFTIVGIMPAAMRFPARQTDVWLPLGLYVNTFPQGRGAHPALTAAGRLKSGVTIERARSTMDAIARRLSDQYPQSNRNSTVVVSPYYELIVRDIRPAMLVLLGAVGVLLLIAVANLASLLLARAEGRHQELTIRAALGAGRRRLVRQLLTEALVLAGLGGALGLLLAYWGVNAFIASRPTTIPRIDLIGIDWRVVLFTLGTTLATGVLFGLLPAFRTSRPDLRRSIGEETRQAGRGSTRVRNALVVAEIAMAVVLLVSGALLVKSFRQLMSADLGFEAANVLTMRVSLPVAKYPSVDSWTGFHQELVSRLSSLPGVEAVGMSSSLPLSGGAGESSMRKEGDPPRSADQPPMMATFHVVNGAYFRAMGIAHVRGRLFDDRDTTASVPVVIADRAAVERLFPGQDPIGRRVAFESRGKAADDIQPIWREIVGVVEHVRHYGLRDEPPYVQLFVPLTQLPTYMVDRRPSMAIEVRTAADAAATIASVRETVRGLDATIPLFSLQPMQDFINQASEQPRMNAALLGAFATIAMVLALVGVYGVLSYSVSCRTREIGVRVALGARPADVVRVIGGQAFVLIASGLVIGAIGAAAATRLLANLLIGVSATDPWTFAMVIVVLGTAAALASFVPIRRASHLDPLAALRAE